jgi:hypothetical protein
MMEKIMEKNKKNKQDVGPKAVEQTLEMGKTADWNFSDAIMELQNEQRKKSIPKDSSPKESGFVSSLQKEVRLLMCLGHPNIIKIFQVIETDSECHIVMYSRRNKGNSQKAVK